MSETLLGLLRQRHSTPSRQLAEPAPDAGQLLDMLAAAVHVPDHGRLTPWRFIELRADGRRRLGDLLVQVYSREYPDATAHALEKEQTRFASAPLVVVVVGRIAAGHRIPEIEQRLSGGAVCLQLLLAAQALGFGAQWLTGWAAYHADIHTALGLAGGEEILGFIHIGTAMVEATARARPDPRELLTGWPT